MKISKITCVHPPEGWTYVEAFGCTLNPDVKAFKEFYKHLWSEHVAEGQEYKLISAGEAGMRWDGKEYECWNNTTFGLFVRTATTPANRVVRPLAQTLVVRTVLDKLRVDHPRRVSF